MPEAQEDTPESRQEQKRRLAEASSVLFCPEDRDLVSVLGLRV